MTVNEGRVPIALATETRGVRIGGLGQIVAEKALPETLWRALLVFVPLALVAALGFLFIYHVATTANRRVLEAGQEKIVQMGRATVNGSLNALVADVSFLSKEGILQDWLSTGDPALQLKLADEYLVFATHKHRYSKVRFIDSTGRERVRADRLDGTPRIVPEDTLQDKSDRPFFTAALNLAEHEIYISPFDLSVENGVIEQPIKPTVRAAAAVFDNTGRKRGVVVLNYIGESILSRIRSLGSEGRGQVWLVNSDSFWLVGPRPEVEWSFALPDRHELTFARAFPAAWDKIKGAPGFGQFAEGGDLFSYVPIFAPATSEEGVNIVSAPVWYLIAHVPSEASDLSDLAQNLGIGLAAALLLLAAIALLLGHHATRRRQAADEIRQLNLRLANDNDALQALNKELESFSYSVSHDLRGPLRAIDGFSKALLEDCSEALGESGRDHLARVRSAAQRMGELIDDLLKLSQIGRSEMSAVDEVDLTKIATAIMENLQRGEPARTVDFVAQPEMRARCDPRMMRIALENLLGNAWKFTGDRKPAVIEFGSTRIGEKTAYFVRDNGVGFDMAHVGKLFRPFQRLHPNEGFPGTGIGLATVERIMKKHGGRIWAESAPDAGATLFFTL